MIRFKHNGVLFELTEQEVMDSIPIELKQRALKRGKTHIRREKQTRREAQAQEAAAVVRDSMLAG